MLINIYIINYILSFKFKKNINDYYSLLIARITFLVFILI